MYATPTHFGHWLVCLTAVLTMSAAEAAPPAGNASTAPSSDAVYQRERAACLDGSSPQDRATCLKEAGAARAESRRSGLGNGEDAGTLSRNALQRCQAVLPEDRDACERMARGEGEVSGSVAGGGVLKQIVTPAPEPASESAPAAPNPVPQR
jgi:hypothetical protein